MDSLPEKETKSPLPFFDPTLRCRATSGESLEARHFLRGQLIARMRHSYRSQLIAHNL